MMSDTFMKFRNAVRRRCTKLKTPVKKDVLSTRYVIDLGDTASVAKIAVDLHLIFPVLYQFIAKQCFNTGYYDIGEQYILDLEAATSEMQSYVRKLDRTPFRNEFTQILSDCLDDRICCASISREMIKPVEVKAGSIDFILEKPADDCLPFVLMTTTPLSRLTKSFYFQQYPVEVVNEQNIPRYQHNLQVFATYLSEHVNRLNKVDFVLLYSTFFYLNYEIEKKDLLFHLYKEDRMAERNLDYPLDREWSIVPENPPTKFRETIRELKIPMKSVPTRYMIHE